MEECFDEDYVRECFIDIANDFEFDKDLKSFYIYFKRPECNICHIDKFIDEYKDILLDIKASIYKLRITYDKLGYSIQEKNIQRKPFISLYIVHKTTNEYFNAKY